MPTLSSANRAQVTFLEEGVYPTNFGVPQEGDGTNVAVTGENLDFTISTETSKILRADRGTSDLVQTGASSQGGLNLEHNYRNLDPILEALMQSTFTAYGTDGLGATVDVSFTSTVMTATVAPSGSSAFTGLQKGQWFTLVPDAAENAAVKDYLAGRAFRVSASVSPTSDTITVDAATPFNTTILAGSIDLKLSSSRIGNGTTMKSYTIEVGHQDIDVYRVYKGMIPSKLSWSMKSNAILTGSLDFMGRSMSLEDASVMGTPVDATSYESANAVRGIFDIFEGGQSVSAVTYIKSADLTFDNALRIQDAIGIFGAAGIASGSIKAMAKLEVYFADKTHYNKFLNNGVTSFSFPVLDPSGNGYVYYFPRMKYASAKVNATGIDQDAMLSMEATALIDNVVGSPTFGKVMEIYRVGR